MNTEPKQARATCALCGAEAVTAAEGMPGKCHSCGGILRRVPTPGPADRVRAATALGKVPTPIHNAFAIALEALEQYDMAAPYPPGKPTRASVAIKRMAYVLDSGENNRG